MNDSDLQVLLNYAYFFLKFRPRSKKEIADYLNKKTEKRHWSRDLVEEAIKDLEERSLINDKEFVRWFVEQRNVRRQKSRFVLTGELLRFGISKDLIDEFFSKNPQPEEELALQALESRWHRFRTLSKKERFEKSASFLARRGFSFEIIRKAIDKLENS